jgi:hypothetical protein
VNTKAGAAPTHFPIMDECASNGTRERLLQIFASTLFPSRRPRQPCVITWHLPAETRTTRLVRRVTLLSEYRRKVASWSSPTRNTAD